MIAPNAIRQSVAVRSIECSKVMRSRSRARQAERHQLLTTGPVASLAQSAHQRPEVLAALLEVAVLVEARAGRREQHGLAACARCARPRRPRARGRRSGSSSTPRRRAGRVRRRSCGLADQVAARGSAPPRAGASAAKSPPFSEPPRIACTPPSNDAQRRRGGRDVGRLRVVHVEDAVDLGHLLEAVRDAAELAQRRAHRLRLDAARKRRRRGRHRVLEVVRAAQRRSRTTSISGSSAPDRCARRRGAARSRRASPNQTRCAAPPSSRPRERRLGGVQHRDVVRRSGARRRAASRRGSCRSSPWRSRWSSAKLRNTADLGRERARCPRAGSSRPRRRRSRRGRARRRAR